MSRPVLRSFVFALSAAGAILAGSKPVSTESVKGRLVALLRESGLYQPPEIPAGCLDWSGARKGDSVLFRPVLSRKSACAGVEPVEQSWIVPRGGATAFLVDGADRTDIRSLTGATIEDPDDADELEGEDVDASDANTIDVILAGGGGSIKKGERDTRETPRSSSGARTGFGVGNGGQRQGVMRLGEPAKPASNARAKVDPPMHSDVELADGGSSSRSPESILRVIRQHVGGFRYTYSKYLRDNPALGGKISLKFTISPSGDVVAISVARSNTGSAELDQEIVDKGRRMKFDQIEGRDVTVTYHFVLDRE